MLPQTLPSDRLRVEGPNGTWPTLTTLRYLLIVLVSVSTKDPSPEGLCCGVPTRGADLPAARVTVEEGARDALADPSPAVLPQHEELAEQVGVAVTDVGVVSENGK